MGELKQHQLPMTIDEQVENLKRIGLIVKNEEYLRAGWRVFHMFAIYVPAMVVCIMQSFQRLPCCIKSIQKRSEDRVPGGSLLEYLFTDFGWWKGIFIKKID